MAASSHGIKGESSDSENHWSFCFTSPFPNGAPGSVGRNKRRAKKRPRPPDDASQLQTQQLKAARVSGDASESSCPKAGPTPPSPPPRIVLNAPGLEITNDEITRGSFELLPWEFMEEPSNRLATETWHNFEELQDHNLQCVNGPFLTFVQRWLDAGTHPVQGKAGKTTMENKLRHKFAKNIAVNIRDTLLSAHQRKQATHIL